MSQLPESFVECTYDQAGFNSQVSCKRHIMIWDMIIYGKMNLTALYLN